MFERESERARVKDKNAHQLSAFLAKLDSDAKRHMDLVLGDWEDQRQSLKDRFDYEDKRNGVLNQRERQRGREGGRGRQDEPKERPDLANNMRDIQCG